MLSLPLAVQFLTVLPVRDTQSVTPEQIGRSLAWYPLVGAGLGLAVGAANFGLQALGMPAMVAAALALTLNIGLTGALHLDGLLDPATVSLATAPPPSALRSCAIHASVAMRSLGAAAFCSSSLPPSLRLASSMWSRRLSPPWQSVGQ